MNMRWVLSFIILITVITPAFAVTTRVVSNARAATATPNAAYNYEYMYPYLNNQMRTDLNPGVTPSQGSNPINVITKTEKLSPTRRVVARGTTTRNATNTATSQARNAAQPYTAPRSATPQASTNTNNTSRRVVARNTARSATQRTSRGDASYLNTTARAAENAISTGGTTLPSSRCLADYTACMNGYCQREKTAYNRCYCSAKLSQIDSQYQPEIDRLIKQILQLRSTNTWSDAEMNQYWMDTVGKYTGENSWLNLENALNIDWAGTESRVRGAQAFATGHDYCVQHLRGCYYMAANLRDAYRSEIARDCATYEAGLSKIKNAAESIVESYND